MVHKLSHAVWMLLVNVFSPTTLLTCGANGMDQKAFKDSFFVNKSFDYYPLRIPDALHQHFYATLARKETTNFGKTQNRFRRPRSPWNFSYKRLKERRDTDDYRLRRRNKYNNNRRRERITQFRRQRQAPEDSHAAPLNPGVYSCGHQGSELFINFINPKYPGQDSSTGSCVFKVEVNSPDVCQVRVDFVDTELLTPDNGNCNDQYLQIGGGVRPNGLKKLCGINSDQHFYIAVDQADQDGIIDFTITTVASGKAYKFGFWITQINCASRSPIEAPLGCTQYFLGREGTVKTFNFEGVQYLTNQNYRICFRAEKEACFMSYQADPNHFMFRVFIQRENRRFNRRVRGVTNPSGKGEDCGLDYVLIPNGRANATRTGFSFDRFCGGSLNIESNTGDNIPIYSEITSTTPWIEVVTAIRDENLQNQIDTRRRPNGPISLLSSIMSLNSGNGGSRRSNSINARSVSVGAGMRLRYSQMNTCLTSSFT